MKSSSPINHTRKSAVNLVQVKRSLIFPQNKIFLTCSHLYVKCESSLKNSTVCVLAKKEIATTNEEWDMPKCRFELLCQKNISLDVFYYFENDLHKDFSPIGGFLLFI